MLLFMLPCCSICATGRRSECRDRISQAAKLLVILARYHGGNETFVMAKPLATILGWRRPAGTQPAKVVAVKMCSYTSVRSNAPA